MEKNHISKKLFYVFSPKDSNIGKFRIKTTNYKRHTNKPKLQKSKFEIRPIINCKQHPTSNICQFIELFLGPYVKNFESYIQDSQNLMQSLNDIYVGNDSFPR